MGKCTGKEGLYSILITRGLLSFLSKTAEKKEEN